MAPLRWPEDAGRLDLVQSDDADLRIKPVGARPVILNSDERNTEMQLRWKAVGRRRNDADTQKEER